MRVALYLRSSKDRSDVSIDAQRAELKKLCASKGWTVVREYADVVLSGKDDYNRPSFLELKSDMKRRNRGWDTVLLLDWQRLARNQLIAHVFTNDAKQFDVRVVYARMPEQNPMVDIIIHPLMHAFAEYHSWESRQKGLAGMSENVKRGFRAGGRAPRGYRLKHIETGAYREGEPVTKSVLDLSDDAAIVSRYLKARAAGRTRRGLINELGLKWPENSLVSMEWNAMTYAGHTVWNMRTEYQNGKGYRGGRKWRPQEEWHIKRDTHPALITEDEAKALIAALQTSRLGSTYRSKASYLLAGLLKTPNGDAWHGNGHGRYRSKTERKNVSQQDVEDNVITQLSIDLEKDELVKALALEAQAYIDANTHGSERHAIRQRMKDLGAKIDRLAGMVADMEEPRAVLKQIDELEKQRASAATELERLQQEAETAKALHGMDEATIRSLLADVVDHMGKMEPEALKDFIQSIVERIELDPSTLECRIVYQQHSRELMASPWGGAKVPKSVSGGYPSPILRLICRMKVAA